MVVLNKIFLLLLIGNALKSAEKISILNPLLPQYTLKHQYPRFIVTTLACFSLQAIIKKMFKQKWSKKEIGISLILFPTCTFAERHLSHYKNINKLITDNQAFILDQEEKHSFPKWYLFFLSPQTIARKLNLSDRNNITLIKKNINFLKINRYIDYQKQSEIIRHLDVRFLSMAFCNMDRFAKLSILYNPFLTITEKADILICSFRNDANAHINDFVKLIAYSHNPSMQKTNILFEFLKGELSSRTEYDIFHDRVYLKSIENLKNPINRECDIELLLKTLPDEEKITIFNEMIIYEEKTILEKFFSALDYTTMVELIKEHAKDPFIIKLIFSCIEKNKIIDILDIAYHHNKKAKQAIFLTYYEIEQQYLENFDTCSIEDIVKLIKKHLKNPSTIHFIFHEISQERQAEILKSIDLTPEDKVAILNAYFNAKLSFDSRRHSYENVTYWASNIDLHIRKNIILSLFQNEKLQSLKKLEHEHCEDESIKIILQRLLTSSEIISLADDTEVKEYIESIITILTSIDKPKKIDILKEIIDDRYEPNPTVRKTTALFIEKKDAVSKKTMLTSILNSLKLSDQTDLILSYHCEPQHVLTIFDFINENRKKEILTHFATIPKIIKILEQPRSINDWINRTDKLTDIIDEFIVHPGRAIKDYDDRNHFLLRMMKNISKENNTKVFNCLINHYPFEDNRFVDYVVNTLAKAIVYQLTDEDIFFLIRYNLSNNKKIGLIFTLTDYQKSVNVLEKFDLNRKAYILKAYLSSYNRNNRLIDKDHIYINHCFQIIQKMTDDQKNKDLLQLYILIYIATSKIHIDTSEEYNLYSDIQKIHNIPSNVEMRRLFKEQRRSIWILFYHNQYNYSEIIKHLSLENKIQILLGLGCFLYVDDKFNLQTYYEQLENKEGISLLYLIINYFTYFHTYKGLTGFLLNDGETDSILYFNETKTVSFDQCKQLIQLTQGYSKESLICKLFQSNYCTFSLIEKIKLINFCEKKTSVINEFNIKERAEILFKIWLINETKRMRTRRDLFTSEHKLQLLPLCKESTFTEIEACLEIPSKSILLDTIYDKKEVLAEITKYFNEWAAGISKELKMHYTDYIPYAP